MPSAENDATAVCTCPRGTVNMGSLHGVRMGPGEVRLRTEDGCPEHDPATHDFVDPYPAGPPPWHVPPRLCKRCHVPRRDHPRRVNPPGEGH